MGIHSMKGRISVVKLKGWRGNCFVHLQVLALVEPLLLDHFSFSKETITRKKMAAIIYRENIQIMELIFSYFDNH